MILTWDGYMGMTNIIKRKPVQYTFQKVLSKCSTSENTNLTTSGSNDFLEKRAHIPMSHQTNNLDTNPDILTLFETFFEKVDIETYALLYKFFET
jgi:hypothetical protein